MKCHDCQEDAVKSKFDFIKVSPIGEPKVFVCERCYIRRKEETKMTLEALKHYFPPITL